MTVGELFYEIENLMRSGFGDEIVVLAKDGEGNSYSPLSDGISTDYNYIDNYEIQLKPEALTDELRAQGFTEEDTDEEGRGQSCIVLWPV